ncbi:polyprenol phosphomannose-dependent alpha 1,6 mannosyltransferase MptB [Cryptosporangium sp. NPDC048952]|uniref:polyprenol phosphomannose-dependent alpha 1,6 mannosyltransferase MptB n=1 Tax=Cryptosporangium sp. NPDC048952 TaxID=3363961 RepID=UPI00372062E0
MTSPSVAAAPATAPGDRFVRFRWLGFAGSVLIGVAAVGAGALPRPDPLTDAPVLRSLRHGVGPSVCITLAAIGMALLVLAWWRSRDADVRGLTINAALWAVPLALAPPLFSRDLYIYPGQGMLLVQGLDPYQVGPSAITSGPGVDWLSSMSVTWLDTPAPYGPLFLAFCGVAARFAGGNLLVAMGLLRLVAVIGVVAFAWLVPRLAAAFGTDPARAQWIAVANPLLLAHLVGGAHNEAVLVPLLAAGLLLAQRHRGVAAGALIGLAAAVKLSAVVVLPFVVLLIAAGLPAASGFRGRWIRILRAAVPATVAALLAIALSCLAAGVGPGFVHALLVTNGISVQWTSLPTGWGLAAGWFTTHDAGALSAGRAVGTVLTLILLVAIWWRVHTTPEKSRRVLVACTAALLVTIVLGAAFHPWYMVWLLVPLAAVADASPRFTTAIAVACTVLCFLVLPDGKNLATEAKLPGTILDVVVTVGLLVCLARRWKVLRHELP